MSEADPSGQGDAVAPPPVTGWHRLVDGGAVSANALLSVEFAQTGLVLYRDLAGKAHVASARCPHNGIDLNCTQAPIENGTIACPLHGWNFDTTTGKCKLIPYNPSKLPNIALKEYRAREQDGEIQIWWE